MKYILVVADGCADLTTQTIQTPLSFAHTPCLDQLSAHGVQGQTCLIPKDCPPGSHAALLTLFGAPASTCTYGRAALEALAFGANLDNRSALRCQFITVQDGTIRSHNADGLTQQEADALINSLSQALGDAQHLFLSGTTYRAFLLRTAYHHTGSVSPDTLLGMDVQAALPEDDDLKRLYYAAQSILCAHPVNQARTARGLLPANAIWFWGGGSLPSLPSFTKRTGLRGGAVGGVPLVHGIAKALGLHWLDTPGADGTLFTNWEGKAFRAFDALKTLDFVFVHIECPDEAGHAGNLPQKVAAIEYLDQRLLSPLTRWLADTPYRLLVLPDHPTPLSLRCHTNGPVPWMLYDSRVSHPGTIYNDLHTADLPFTPGNQLLNLLLERNTSP